MHRSLLRYAGGTDETATDRTGLGQTDQFAQCGALWIASAGTPGLASIADSLRASGHPPTTSASYWHSESPLASPVHDSRRPSQRRNHSESALQVRPAAAYPVGLPTFGEA